MRTAGYILLVLGTYLVQVLILPWLLNNRWQPDLFLVWIILIALFRSGKASFLWAAVGGLIYDVVISNFFGLHFFPYILVAFLFHFIGKKREEINLLFAVGCIALATVVDGVLRFLLLQFAQADVHFFAFVGIYIWSHIWWHILFGSGFYFVVKSFDEEEEYIW